MCKGFNRKVSKQHWSGDRRQSGQGWGGSQARVHPPGDLAEGHVGLIAWVDLEAVRVTHEHMRAVPIGGQEAVVPMPSHLSVIS